MIQRETGKDRFVFLKEQKMIRRVLKEIHEAFKYHGIPLPTEPPPPREENLTEKE